MPKRAFLPAPRRTPCIGDLTQQVRLLARAIQPPVAGATDFSERFTEVAKPWADVRTTQGTTFFDGTTQDIPVTHRVFMRFRADVDTESWIELRGGSRLRVLRAEDLEDRGEWLKLTCTEKGPDSIKAAHA